MKEIDRSLLDGIPPPSGWPDRYRLHKYWGRKAPNVVRYLIDATTKEGDLTLDPFSGSGVLAIESALAGRHATAVDINPVANFIAQTTITASVSGETLTNVAREVVERAVANDPLAKSRSAASLRSDLSGSIRSVIWENDQPIAAKIETEGVIREVSLDDRMSQRWIDCQLQWDNSAAPNHPVFEGWQTRKMKKAGMKSFNELFRPRNLAFATAIRRQIDLAPTQAQPGLLVAFTAAIAQMTRMMADYRGRGGGPSWKINIFWMPAKSQELDPIRYFMNRVAKVSRAFDEVRSMKPIRGSAQFVTGDVRSVDDVPESIDFVFADPPYGGEGIQYLELSTLWNYWLDPDYEFDGSKEISSNHFHTNGVGDYAGGLSEAFVKTRKLLKEGNPLVVTFNNKDQQVWRILMNAAETSGFELKGAVALGRSARSLTETVADAAPNADYFLLFR